MFNPQRYGAILYFKGITFPATSPTHKCKCNPFFLHYPSLFSLHYFCTASGSFAASYLINNLGFSSDSAFRTSKILRFNTSQKPDSVLNFFRNWGFSNPQLHHIIKKVPWLLSCEPHKRVLPKFEFLLSKGVSTSDIVSIVTKSPRLLAPSLENHIIPTYELLHRFLQSDKKTIACIICHTPSFCSSWMKANVKLLIDYGVSDSNIARLLCRWPSIFCKTDLLKELEEVKELGFNPSKSTFIVALLAKGAVSKSRWNEKVDFYRKWGWSDENILEAFRRQPNCMLVSCDKINAVMSFWVNQLGLDALALVKEPLLFGFSLEKRIIPRAFIVQYLLAKGMIKKNASIFTPIRLREEVFLKKYVKCFKEEETSRLLKLYLEKMNLQDNGEDGCI